MANSENSRQELDLRLFRVMRNMSKVVFKNIEDDVIEYGLDTETFQILELVFSKGPQPIQKISEKLSIPSGSITYVVDKLEKKGYVQRIPIPGDRRKTNVTLTEEGQAYFDDIFPRHVNTISNNLSFVSDEEKQLLITLLKKIGYGAKDIQS
ncbi:MarR family winged helix-turn-helix transcriptional regulator [Cohnella silvisoli]|uniref:MarR family transcriptional regulator n=1 Tax=Cohnella silvisoli TaxID=2873699 RepID=A0ABV1KT95_9BACL|nr:MarR family transcriptional regulator [Cohnella silvisoli]MCD9021525.1 MarR family transcriptional regulator [Cohnella silvisoli]